MNNLIDRMMEKYGVECPNERPQDCKQRINQFGFTCLGCMEFDEEKEECTHKGSFPPFTPEKQLKIIKLMNVYGGFEIYRNKITFRIYHLGMEFNHCCDMAAFRGSFEETMAYLMVVIYSRITPAQRQQIKEILEG